MLVCAEADLCQKYWHKTLPFASNRRHIAAIMRAYGQDEQTMLSGTERSAIENPEKAHLLTFSRKTQEKITSFWKPVQVT